MKMITSWWGIALIPDNEEEVALLDQMPKKSEGDNYYTDGTGGWLEDQGTILCRMDSGFVDVPMDKAWVISR